LPVSGTEPQYIGLLICSLIIAPSKPSKINMASG